jgi:hypothetical protein
MSDGRPSWLVEYLLDRQVVPMATPAVGLPQQGDLRLAKGAFETRLVLVIGRVNEVAIECLLLSSDTEYATDQDVLLATTETGLPYDLIAETDVVGPVDPSVLGPRLGRLNSHDLLRVISDAVLGLNIPQGLGGRLGLPIAQISDPRRAWKEAEATFLTATFALQADAATVMVVDPSLFLPECGLTEVEARRLFLDVVHGRACLGPRSLRSFVSIALGVGRRTGWMLDAARRLVNAAPTACAVDAMTRGISDWTGPERVDLPGTFGLPDLVADIASMPGREIRLATCDRLWTTGGHDRLQRASVRRFGLPTLTVKLLYAPEVLHV